jgi:hypothetical protein
MPQRIGRRDLLRVGDEIVGDLLLANESIGASRKLHAREPVMPGRPIRDQRIPARAAPALGNATALEHEMGNIGAAQVLAHGHAGLACAYDEHLGFLDRHWDPWCITERRLRIGAGPRTRAVRRALHVVAVHWQDTFQRCLACVSDYDPTRQPKYDATDVDRTTRPVFASSACEQ